MYTKEQASQLTREFWTAFGKYMQPILSADGEKINWMNYKTGDKHIRFRMFTERKLTMIAVEINHTDADLQQLYFTQMLQLKHVFNECLGEEWVWDNAAVNENNKPICLVYQELEAVSIYNKNHWPQIISFFKPRIIALDEWWSMVKYQFAALR